MPRYITLCILIAVALVLSQAQLRAAAPAAPGTDTPDPAGGATVTAFPTVTAPDAVVQWMVDQVSEDKVRQYDGDLSGEWLVTIRGSSYQILTRNTYSGVPIQNAVYYVGDHFTSLDLGVLYDEWGPATAPSVIGEKTGATRPGEIFLVTAHLDDKPGGSPAPGADDNASGSAAVLVAADILSQFTWDCTLRFALWTGEEQGLLGSASYADKAKQNTSGETIRGVFNLDMIGWNRPGSPRDIDLQANSAMPATVDLAYQAASVVGAYGLALIPQVYENGSTSSDHASFWNQGYTAILGIEDYYPLSNNDFNPDYHTTRDKLLTLDLGYFTEYVKVAVAETAHMAGCLTTGALEGQVLAGHDNSPIPNAEIRLQDTVGREYRLHASPSGSYSQAVPPGAYAATVAAYGYETRSVTGIDVSARVTSTQNLVLTSSAPPTPPAVSAAPYLGGVSLTWPHVSPDTGYQVHRSDSPYFEPGEGTLRATLDAAHLPSSNELLTYPDPASSAGSASTNHFYLVLGMNAAGASSVSNQTGVFDFALTPGDGS